MAQDGTASTAAASVEPAAKQECELHVFPTENYIGFNSGLLSGFGIVGAVADQEVHKNKVASVNSLMKDYLGPDIQLAELEKINYRARLAFRTGR